MTTGALSAAALPPFSPFADDLRASLYETYELYRAREPIHWGAPVTAHDDGCWYVFRYRDAEAILKDPRFGVEPSASSMRPTAPSARAPRGGCPFADLRSRWMLFRDPPFHTRVRGAMARRFNVALARRLRPEVGAIAHALIDRVVESGWMDGVADYALELPLRVLGACFGLPASEVPRLRDWAGALLGQLAAESRSGGSPAVQRRADAAALELDEYFTAWLRERAAFPDPSGESDPWRPDEEGEAISESELVASLGLLLWTAYETTANLIANGLLALLRHPRELDALRDDLAGPRRLLAPAVEELVRFDCPAQMTLRFAHEDLELGNGGAPRSVRLGEPVVVLLGAANRDPERFSEPDRLDLSRGAHHLGFGSGAHFCLGTELARIEGQEALAALVERLPRMKLETGRPEWLASSDPALIRRLRSLFVSFPAA